jgi:hypothetical protein
MTCKICARETVNLGRVCSACLDNPPYSSPTIDKIIKANEPRPMKGDKPTAEDLESAGPFRHGCGGGHRVVRDSRTLS